MALDIKTLDNWITYEGSGRVVLDSLIIETIKQNDLMEDHKQYKSLLNYTDTTLLSPDQKFSSRLPNGWLRDVTETWIKTQRDFNFWPKKGLSQREIWEKFTMSYLFSQWSRKAQTLSWAPESIQAELVQVAEQSKDLMVGYDITYAEELVKVLSLWFAVTTAEWPWSATARNWLALFSASHLLKDGSTFSNIVTWSAYTDVATGQTKLQTALDLLKTMKFDNGKKVKQSKMYTLYCSRAKETHWLEVINNGSTQSWVGSNSAKENVFNFRNNMVKVVVLDLLWDTDSNGTVIWADAYWFLANTDTVTKMKSLRCATLYSPRIKSWENDETDEMNTSIRAVVWAWHFDAEFTIVGSIGS